MIDTEKNKLFIYDCAVRGELSETLLSDTPIDETINKLPEPSNKRKKVLKLNLSYDEQYDIPETWRWIKLGLITTFGDGQEKVLPANVETKDVWLLELEDIEKGGRVLRKRTLANSDTKGDKVVFSKGQLLYSKLRPYLKKNLIADEDGVATPELIPVTVLGGVNPYYVLYYLMGNYVSSMIDRRSYGIKMPRVDVNFMINLPIPLPPIEEQERIVKKIQAVCEELDSVSSLQQQYANNITSLNKKILDLAVRGKLVPQDPNDEPASVLLKKIAEEKQKLIKEGKIKKQKTLPTIPEDEIPFDIPESWEWVRFSSVMNVVSTGPFGSMLHKSDYVETGIPIVNPVHMVNSKIVPGVKASVTKETAERLEAYKLHTGDLVLARRGDIGRSAVVSESEEGWLCGTGSFFASPSKGINPEYISLMLSSEYAKGILLGNSVGTTMNNLNQGILNNFIFPLPPTMEQERILNAVQDMDDYLAKIVSINN